MCCKNLKGVRFGPCDDYRFEGDQSYAGESKLERIGRRAFLRSGLESFIAPESLREIGEGAFLRCSALRSIYLNDELEILGTHCFRGVPATEVRVPVLAEVCGSLIGHRGPAIKYYYPGAFSWSYQ